MKKKSIKKRTIAVLLVITMFITYTPVISYALAEEMEDRNDAAAEVAEDLTSPEAETEELEGKTEDSETIDSLLLGLEPSESENERVLSERNALKSRAALTGSKRTTVIKAEDIRLWGPNRYETSKKVADEYKSVSGAEFENVVVAYGLNYPDALSGVYLAKVKNAPILLVQPSVEDDIANYINENIADGGNVYILGSAAVVSSAFENKIRAKGIYPIRLGGKDRYETNIKILEEAGVDDEELMVCTGTGYADSLSASAAGKPILLVGSTLTDDQKEYIQSWNPEKLYLIGSTGVVSGKVEAELRRLGYDPERLWGPNRYETSKAVAERFFNNNPQTVVLTYALNFPDGLSGGPLAMLEEAPIILTDSSNIEAARSYVESSGAYRSITLGSTSLISQLAVRTIMDRKPPYITPEKKYVKVQVGETAEIRVDSNYGTTWNVRDKGGVIEDVGAPDATYTDTGLSIERYTVTGKQAGTAVLVLTDSYLGSETDAVTVTVIDGEASVKTLYDIIDATGYEDNDGRKAVKWELEDNITVYFENHSNYVRLVWHLRNSASDQTLTTMNIPLETQDVYPATIINKQNVHYKTDINPGQYTSGAALTIKNIANPSEEEKSFVTSTFGDSMTTWNSVLEGKYEMIMKDLGFTSY